MVENAWQLGSRVETLLQLHKDSAALAAAREASAHYPEDAFVARSLAKALAANDHPDALEAARRAASLAPQDVGAQLVVAATLARLRRNDDAYEAYVHARKIAPHNAMIPVWMAEMLIREVPPFVAGEEPRLSESDKERLDRIRDLAREAVMLDPARVETHITAGKAALLRGDLAEADEHLDRAGEIAPNEAVLHQVRGLVAKRRGEYDSAREQFKTAARANARRADWTTHALARLDAETGSSPLQRLRRWRARRTAE